jgi:hypothetical protein
MSMIRTHPGDRRGGVRATFVLACLLVAACRSPAEESPPGPASRPAAALETTSQPATTAPAETQPAADPPPPTPPPPIPMPPQTGWLRIIKLNPGAAGGWATGDVDRPRNKIIISTHDVGEFALDQSALGVRWDRRVILRINNRSVELRKKSDPMIYFRQTRAGVWEVIRQSP